jgi:hypothetical protein
MKLLLDENLSPKLPSLLKGTFPGSKHVRECGLKGKTDRDEKQNILRGRRQLRIGRIGLIGAMREDQADLPSHLKTAASTVAKSAVFNAPSLRMARAVG